MPHLRAFFIIREVFDISLIPFHVYPTFSFKKYDKCIDKDILAVVKVAAKERFVSPIISFTEISVRLPLETKRIFFLSIIPGVNLGTISLDVRD